MKRTLGILVALAALGGCARPPDVEARLGPPTPGTDYPSLLPISDLLAIDAGIPEDADDEADLLEARAAALRARAAALSADP